MKSEQFTTVLDLATLGESFGAGQVQIAAEHIEGIDNQPASGSRAPASPSAVTIGVLLGFDDRGEALVAGRPGDRLPARSLVPLGLAELGREVVLAFEGGDPGKPIIMGLVQPPRPRRTDPSKAPDDARPVEVRVDGERLLLTADKEIVLRCGEASITLTRAGKVLIKGAYVLSRSTGMNRIQGGVVHIN